MDPAAELRSISSISALLAALTAVIGGAVVLSGRRRPAHLRFLVLSTNLFVWHVLSIFRSTGGSALLTYLALGALVLVPASLLGFLRTWLRDSATSSGLASGYATGYVNGASPVEPPFTRSVPRTVTLAFIAIELALLYAYSVRHDPSQAWAQRIPAVVKGVTLIGLYAALWPLWRVYRSTMSRVDKRRLLYLVSVGALAIGVSALDYLPPPIGRGGPALGSVLTVVYLYFLQQTLFFDRLLDINELLGKVVVLSAFVLLLSAIQTVLSIIGVDQRQVVTVVALVILLLYEPLRTFLEGQVQRFTARERYELLQHLSELRQTLANIIEPREAVRLVLSVFEETRRLTQASVYLLEHDGSGYELVGHFGTRPVERIDAAARRPLFARLAATRQPITLEQLDREHESLIARRGSPADIETLDAIARTLVELHAGAVVGILSTSSAAAGGRGGRIVGSPGSGAMNRVDAADTVVLGEPLLGLLCVKDKDERPSEAYAAFELDVFTGIAAQLGITLQNSKLYDRMKERDRLAALGQMAAGLAHEIRNPLGAIKGAAEFIAPQPGAKVPEDADDFLRIIIEETKRLNRVVSQFLDYARPFRGDLQTLDMNAVLEKIVVLLRPLIDEAVSARPGAAAPELHVELAPELPAARGDAEQLRQVFLNLAINAVQAMLDDDSGRPRVLTVSTGLRHGGRLGAPTQHIEVRVQDTGPGIDPAVQKNLFIPFFTTKDKGTGLGLPISQRIVENHGGFIEIKSRPGGGATFIVVLPVAE